jgi:radical SAM superfamily enzyme YgiQ (UPF0313 family)
MRIALVFPRMKYKSGDPPLGLALLASIIRREGYEVTIIDSTFNFSLDYVNSRLDIFKPDYVCIYIDSLSFKYAISIAKKERLKKRKVIFGGPHATLESDSIKEFADYIVVGESEDAIIEILKGKHNKKIVKTKRPDISNLPIPAYDLLEMNKYFKFWHLLDSIDPKIKGTSIITSRGCPYNCSFCQPVLEKIFGKGVRSRTVKSVIEELKYLKEKYSIQGVFFHDDTFTVRRRWVMDFCKALERENLELLWGINSRVDLLDEELLRVMYKAGLRVMHLGVETGSQRVSDEIYNKGIDLSKVPKTIETAEKIGISCLCFFMIGAPGETIKEINQTIKFARSLNCSEITATIATPLPGTYLYEKTKTNYAVTDDFSNFDYYKNSAFKNPDVSFKRLKYLQKKLLFRFYTHPKRFPYILKHLTSISGIKKMFLKIKRFL